MDHKSEKIPAGSMGKSNTLKGIAISAVLINHYINLNVSGDHWGYANLWVSIFFIISGYGLYFSTKNHLAGHLRLKEVLAFFGRRILRIYPLLWLAWPIEFALRGGDLSFWTLTGIHASEHYWFIPALLHCYFLSPFLYWALGKKPLVTMALLFALIVFINIAYMADAIPPGVMDVSVFLHWIWRDFYFLHIFFFALGAALPLIAAHIKGSRFAKHDGRVAVLWGLVFTTMALAVFFKHNSHVNSVMYKGFMVAPLIPLGLLCGYSIFFSLRLRLFESIGRISYPIYLFHMSFFLVINKTCAFPENSLSEVVLVLFLFPLFLLVCRLLEKLGEKITRLSRSGINHLAGRPAQALGQFILILYFKMEK
jgi:peptidoglycan/LPS O-acetylase OafA/YrhL